MLLASRRWGLAPLALLSLAACGRLGFEDTAALTAQDASDSSMDARASDGGPVDAGADSAVPPPPPLCGDGEVNGSDTCDDGNGTNGDGCDNDCTFSCSSAAECDDGDSCNGVETCDPTTHVCQAGASAMDGAACGMDGACRAGTCAPAGCGDGVVNGSEECDDDNVIEGDGCENDCTFSCSSAAECDDGESCTSESCDSVAHTCANGPSLADGADCDRDMNGSTRDICLSSTCVPTRCGDLFVDLLIGEECEDGNNVNGDGCERDCTFSCEVDADCADTETCNGVEVCDTSLHVCAAGVPLSDGVPCASGTCDAGACTAAPTDSAMPLPDGGFAFDGGFGFDGSFGGSACDTARDCTSSEQCCPTCPGFQGMCFPRGPCPQYLCVPPEI